MPEPLLTRYMQPLLAGRRAECFALITDALHDGREARDVISDVVWPAMNQVDRLFRDDQINAALENMACRINRAVAAQVQPHLPRHTANGRRILILCSLEPREEVRAQMTADLFQADGWESYFVGGGVPHDEVVKLAGELRPDVLLIYGAQPSDVPLVRALIGMIREIGVCPTMNIAVSGGVFDRADGLWQEVGADATAETGPGLVEAANRLQPRIGPAPRPAGLVKKRHRRRKNALAAPGLTLTALPAEAPRAGVLQPS